MSTFHKIADQSPSNLLDVPFINFQVGTASTDYAITHLHFIYIRQNIKCNTKHRIFIGNGIFSMLFLMELGDEQRAKFFGTIVNCLLDFTELNPAAPVTTFLQVDNSTFSHISF